MLENYVKKERPSKKSENKLIETIIKNQKTIRNMNTYYNQETQTKERDNVESLSSSLQDNSSTNSLYLPRY